MAKIRSAEYKKLEILKSLAYGATPAKVATVYGISKDEAAAIKKDNADTIAAIKSHYNDLEKGGNK
jgi:hypothetical protein